MDGVHTFHAIDLVARMAHLRRHQTVPTFFGATPLREGITLAAGPRMIFRWGVEARSAHRRRAVFAPEDVFFFSTGFGRIDAVRARETNARVAAGVATPADMSVLHAQKLKVRRLRGVHWSPANERFPAFREVDIRRRSCVASASCTQNRVAIFHRGTNIVAVASRCQTCAYA
jgi:hypothetical protein